MIRPHRHGKHSSPGLVVLAGRGYRMVRGYPEAPTEVELVAWGRPDLEAVVVSRFNGVLTLCALDCVPVTGLLHQVSKYMLNTILLFCNGFGGCVAGSTWAEAYVVVD